jgi:hydroxyacylglutathione hydrolase
MSEERSSTIAHERDSNSALEFRDVQEFVLVSASVSTPRPPTTERVVAMNRGPWLAKPDDPDELDDPGESTVLDVRAFESHAAGHRPGSISIPLSSGSLGTKAGFVLADGEQVVLHAATRAEALDAAWKLWAVGILDIAGYVLETDLSEKLATADPTELRTLLERADVQVVDVREPAERDEGYLPGSTNIPYRLLRKAGTGALRRDQPVVTVCESGSRAALAASLLQREGFDVRPVADGGIADLTGDIVSFRRCGG